MVLQNKKWSSTKFWLDKKINFHPSRGFFKGICFLKYYLVRNPTMIKLTEYVSLTLFLYMFFKKLVIIQIKPGTKLTIDWCLFWISECYWFLLVNAFFFMLDILLHVLNIDSLLVVYVMDSKLFLKYVCKT